MALQHTLNSTDAVTHHAYDAVYRLGMALAGEADHAAIARNGLQVIIEECDCPVALMCLTFTDQSEYYTAGLPTLIPEEATEAIATCTDTEHPVTVDTLDAALAVWCRSHNLHVILVRDLHGDASRIGRMALLHSSPHHFTAKAIRRIDALTPLLSTALVRAERACAQNEARRSEQHHHTRNVLAMICALQEMEMLQADPPEREHRQTTLARLRNLAQMHNLLLWNHTSHVELGVLLRGVMNSVMGLFGTPEQQQVLHGDTHVSLDTRKSTYLAMLLTELTVHLALHTVSHGHLAYPELDIDANDSMLTLTLRDSSAVHLPCSPLSPLTRDIVIGLAERSLSGQLHLFEQSVPFRAVIRCRLDAS